MALGRGASAHEPAGMRPCLKAKGWPQSKPEYGIGMAGGSQSNRPNGWPNGRPVGEADLNLIQ